MGQGAGGTDLSAPEKRVLKNLFYGPVPVAQLGLAVNEIINYIGPLVIQGLNTYCVLCLQ